MFSSLWLAQDVKHDPRTKEKKSKAEIPDKGFGGRQCQSAVALQQKMHVIALQQKMHVNYKGVSYESDGKYI